MNETENWDQDFDQDLDFEQEFDLEQEQEATQEPEPESEPEEDEEDVLDIRSIFEIFWNDRKMIAILAAVGCLVMLVYTLFFVKPQYVAYGILYVSNRRMSAVDTMNDSTDGMYYTQTTPGQQGKGTAFNSGDIGASRTISSTYVEILRTSNFLEEISRSMAQMVSWEEIRSMLTIAPVDETELLQVTVRSSDQRLAYAVACKVMERAPGRLSDIFQGGEVRSVDDVRFPEKPAPKGIPKKMLIGLAAGFALGLLISFIKDLFSNTLRSSGDLTKRYGISVLGEIAKALPTEQGQGMPNKFDTVETYKIIRTNIMFSIPKTEKGKVITITSAAPGEGKTTTTINLAITFAQTDAKVILLDCDLRKARVHRYLRMERKEGMSNLLCGFCDLEQAIRHEVRKNLDVITAGEIPPNPAELMASEEYAKLLAELRERYDYIFIDTPPVTVVTDAVMAMKQSQGVVLVTRQDLTSFDLLDNTIDTIQKADARIFGAVVLDSTEKQRKYGYYRGEGYRYGHKYGYKYGYGYGYGYAYGDNADEEEEKG